MKTFIPKQSGTFSNRVSVYNTEDVQLFTIEFCQNTNTHDRLFLAELLTCSADMLKALKKIVHAVDKHPESMGLLNMQINNAKAILEAIDKTGNPLHF